MNESMPSVTDGPLMMVNTLYVKPERRGEYLAALTEVLPQARSLPACLALEVGEVSDEPGTFILAERWRSGTEYVNEILRLPFFAAYLEKSEGLYAAPRVVSVLEAH